MEHRDSYQKRFTPSLADTEEKQTEKFMLGLNSKARRMLEAFDPKTYEEALRMAKALEEPLEEKNPEPMVVVGKKRPIEAGPMEFQSPLQRPRHQDRRPSTEKTSVSRMWETTLGQMYGRLEGML